MGTEHPMGGRPQCTAHSKQTGERCKQRPIPGGRVCHYHGGAIPQVKAAAQERLRAFQEPALNGLVELIEQTQFPSVRYAAIKDVLDRTLGRATESLNVTSTGIAELMALLNRWKQEHREGDG